MVDGALGTTAAALTSLCDDRPVDDATGIGCGCAEGGATSFPRECDYCGTEYDASQCVHAAFQTPCPECDVLPVPQLPNDDSSVNAPASVS